MLVNEAFARRYMKGASPCGARVRYASSDPAKPEPWLEIVGMVRDIGMTPTDLGEAPYVFHAASPGDGLPAGDGCAGGRRPGGAGAARAGHRRQISTPACASTKCGRSTSSSGAWTCPMMVAAGAIAGVVGLGLFLSAAGIFSLMSVSVARRTREIGLRTALGASRARLLAGIFSRAVVLVGSGVAAGNLVLLLFVTLVDRGATSPTSRTRC